jgi:hypothetical protein
MRGAGELHAKSGRRRSGVARARRHVQGKDGLAIGEEDGGAGGAGQVMEVVGGRGVGLADVGLERQGQVLAEAGGQGRRRGNSGLKGGRSAARTSAARARRPAAHSARERERVHGSKVEAARRARPGLRPGRGPRGTAAFLVAGPICGWV